MALETLCQVAGVDVLERKNFQDSKHGSSNDKDMALTNLSCNFSLSAYRPEVICRMQNSINTDLASAHSPVLLDL